MCYLLFSKNVAVAISATTEIEDTLIRILLYVHSNMFSCMEFDLSLSVYF